MTSVNSEQEMFKFCEMNRLLIIHHGGDDRIRMKCKSVIYGCRFAAFAKADDNGTFQIYSKNHHERHKEPLRPKTKLVNKMSKFFYIAGSYMLVNCSNFRDDQEKSSHDI